MASVLTCLVLQIICIPQNLQAQSSSGSDDVQLVYALYGSGDSFVDATDRIIKLFQGDDFFAHSDILNANLPSQNGNSLIIFFNYDGGGHFFVRQDNAGKIDLQLLKAEAKLAGQQSQPYSLTTPPASDMKIDFVLYGVHSIFMDVTETSRKALRDSPSGFIPDSGVLGGDPEYGSYKSAIFIYDYDGHRNIYATQNKDAKVNFTTLKAMAQNAEK